MPFEQHNKPSILGLLVPALVMMICIMVVVNLPYSMFSALFRQQPVESELFESFEYATSEEFIAIAAVSGVGSVVKSQDMLYLESLGETPYQSSHVKTDYNKDVERYLLVKGISVTDIDPQLGLIPPFKIENLGWYALSFLILSLFLSSMIKLVTTVIMSVQSYRMNKRMMAATEGMMKSMEGVMSAKPEKEAMGGFGILFGGGGFPGSEGDKEIADIVIEGGKTGVSLSDVIGIDSLKEDISRLVDYLKAPDKYERLGARAPKGVILYGAPGTGKTMLAKAIANEAQIPFLSINGADFNERYVGVGASRVRALFKKARSVAPCIVFIDEVDGVASNRDDFHSESSRQTVNALLSELDGFQHNSGVLTICATNQLDVLDGAFKRAGRFDLRLAVAMPNRDARLRILKVHSHSKPLDDSVNLESLADQTVTFSGADLETVLNEAAMLAAQAGCAAISSQHVDDALFKFITDGGKHKNIESRESLKVVAYHEAGHALATKLLTKESVPTVTIVGSTSGMGGATFRVPDEGGLHSKEYLRNQIKVLYAGRAAEEIYLGDESKVTTGASSDIKQATELIMRYIAAYGMGNFGLLNASALKVYPKDTITEATALSKELYTEVKAFLRTHKELLGVIAEQLYAVETLKEAELDELMA